MKAGVSATGASNALGSVSIIAVAGGALFCAGAVLAAPQHVPAQRSYEAGGLSETE